MLKSGIFRKPHVRGDEPLLKPDNADIAMRKPHVRGDEPL